LELTSIAADVSGDAFWLLVVGSDGFPRIQMIPAHRVGSGLDNGKVSVGKYKGFKIYDGVIYTSEQRAVAYRVLTGDEMQTFVDVDAANMIHVFDPSYCDQTRGLPAFTHALEDLKSSLSSTCDERMRQQIVSRLFLTVFNESGGPDLDDPINNLPNENSGATGIATHNMPGGITYLTAGSGEKIEQLPQTTPGEVSQHLYDLGGDFHLIPYDAHYQHRGS
jgi:hypothetical protein